MPGTPPYTLARLLPPPCAISREDSGNGRVVGTTQVYNAPNPDYPVARRVRLIRQRDGAKIRETWSDAAGNYVFNHVREGQLYDVVSHDHTGSYNAVIAASVLAEPMP